MRVEGDRPGRPGRPQFVGAVQGGIGQPDGRDAGGVGQQGGLAGPESPRRALFAGRPGRAKRPAGDSTAWRRRSPSLTELRTRGGRPAGARAITPPGSAPSRPITSTSRRSRCSSPCGRTPTIPRSPPRPPRCSKTRNRPGIPRSGAARPPSRKGSNGDLFATPLLGLKAFRTLVIRALADKTEVGTVETDADGTGDRHPGSPPDRQRSATAPSAAVNRSTPAGPRAPSSPARTAMPLRMADQACETLQQLEGIPRFQKHWPLAKRDEAIAATVAYLKRYGERFRENAASRAIRAGEPGIPNHERAILAFDPLDHPATADDVAAGPGHLLARRRRGRGPPRRAAVVPDRPPGGRSWRSSPTIPPSCASSMARAMNHPNIEAHADRPGLAGRGGARGRPLASLLRVRRPPCPDPRARRGDRVPCFLAAPLIASLGRPTTGVTLSPCREPWPRKYL